LNDASVRMGIEVIVTYVLLQKFSGGLWNSMKAVPNMYHCPRRSARRIAFMLIGTVTGRVVLVTITTGSSSDDWI
jgi:hypothetical protein